ncbi:MAG: alpha/beta hydrolase [Chloroflexota bacterium]
MTALTARAIPATQRAHAPYCTTHGRGTPLLLIHDFGTSGELFQPIIPLLAKHYYVIIPDLRGHGHSSRLPTTNNIAQLTNDIASLLNLLNISSSFVLGYGAGGAIAQQFAREHPDRVRGLVLTCSYARSTRNVGEQIESRMRRGMRTVIGRNEGTNPNVRTQLAFDSRRWLPQLDCPALVVSGEADTVATVQNARELTKRISNARMKTVRGADHRLIQTHSNDLMDIVLPWLADQENTTW